MRITRLSLMDMSPPFMLLGHKRSEFYIIYYTLPFPISFHFSNLSFPYIMVLSLSIVETHLLFPFLYHFIFIRLVLIFF